MILLALLILGLIVAAIPMAIIVLVLKLWAKSWKDPMVGPAKRIAIISGGVLAMASPYLVYRGFDIFWTFSRVPAPLHATWIDYRLEENHGIGLPGDNETGFIVYRLTQASTQWALGKGSRLGEELGGSGWKWRSTPVDDVADRQWHHYDRNSASPGHPPNLKEYLEQYGGFSTAVDENWIARANQAIRNPGSVYSYGPGGLITIVDPSRGKVYVAYAG